MIVGERKSLESVQKRGRSALASGRGDLDVHLFSAATWDHERNVSLYYSALGGFADC